MLVAGSELSCTLLLLGLIVLLEFLDCCYVDVDRSAIVYNIFRSVLVILVLLLGKSVRTACRNVNMSVNSIIICTVPCISKFACVFDLIVLVPVVEFLSN